MWPFKECVHPAALLGVKSEQTVHIVDADFDRVDYHLFCRKCGSDVGVGYVKLREGVDGFLKPR